MYQFHKKSHKTSFYKGNPEVKKNQKTFLEEYIFISDFSYIMIFCAISIQNTQGPIGPGQWKLVLKVITFTTRFFSVVDPNWFLSDPDPAILDSNLDLNPACFEKAY